MGREQFSLLCLKDEKKKSDVHHQAKVNPAPQGTALNSREENKPQVSSSLNGNRWLYDQWVCKTMKLT